MSKSPQFEQDAEESYTPFQRRRVKRNREHDVGLKKKKNGNKSIH